MSLLDVKGLSIRYGDAEVVSDLTFKTFRFFIYSMVWKNNQP